MLSNLLADRAELQRAVEVTERLRQISGNRVMNTESNHKLKEFSDEILGRASMIIADMGHEFDRVIRIIVGQLSQFKQELLLIGWDGIRFAETKWLLDGQLQIRFMVDRPVPPDPELFHAIVDPFVLDVVEQFDLPPAFRDELAGFCKGLMLQFATIKKHVVDFDLRAVRFDRFQWEAYDTLRAEILYNGKRLLPRDIGW